MNKRVAVTLALGVTALITVLLLATNPSNASPETKSLSVVATATVTAIATSVSTPVPVVWKLFFPSIMRAALQPPAEIAKMVWAMCRQGCNNLVLHGVLDGSGTKQDIRAVKAFSADCTASFEVPRDFQFSGYSHDASGNHNEQGEGPANPKNVCVMTFFFAGPLE